MSKNWFSLYRYRSISVMGIVMLALALPATAVAQDRDCKDFSTQEEAQQVLDGGSGDTERLDGDGNGQACESLPSEAASDSGSGDSGTEESQSSLADTGFDAWLFGAAGLACIGGAMLLRRRQT